MRELLRISGLWGGYKDGVDILKGVDLVVNEGEVIGIIGLNGSGKSTLGKAIMNMIPIRRGVIEFEGEDITRLSTHMIARRGISIMQQGGQVFPNLSVWENLDMAFGHTSGTISSYEKIKDIIPLLQSSKRELQHKMADKLSGGQKHQLALAMSLASLPRLVILDEPSAGLSPIAVEDMYSIIASIKERFNMSIILIEQNVSKAIQNCERCALLRQGIVSQSFKKGEIADIESVIFK